MILINNKKINSILLQDRKFIILMSSRNRVLENEFEDTGKIIEVENKTYNILLKKK